MQADAGRIAIAVQKVGGIHLEIIKFRAPCLSRTKVHVFFGHQGKNRIHDEEVAWTWGKGEKG